MNMIDHLNSYTLHLVNWKVLPHKILKRTLFIAIDEESGCF